MRVLGVLLLVGGCIGGCASLAEDTTVETRGGDRVHNIGLVSERQNHLILSGFVAIAGILFMGFGEVVASRQAPPARTGPPCPMCNAILEGQPQICRHCRSQLRWVDGVALTPEQFEEHQRAQARERQRKEQATLASVERFAHRTQGIGRGVASSARRAGRGLLSPILGAGLWFNGLIRRSAGEGNEIVYRFLQVLLYLGVPAAIAASVIAGRR
jgi:hypothetical protein